MITCRNAAHLQPCIFLECTDKIAPSEIMVMRVDAHIDQLAACRHPAYMRVEFTPSSFHSPGIRYQLCKQCGSWRIYESRRQGGRNAWGAWERPYLVRVVLEQFDAPKPAPKARRKHTPYNPNACPICAPGRCEVARRREQRP